MIALDLRGHGESGKPHDAAQYGFKMSEDIARLLDHLDLDKAHVLGYSLGAVVTNRFRVKHPNRLLTIILGGQGAGNQESVWVRGASEWADGILRGDVGPLVRASGNM